MSSSEALLQEVYGELRGLADRFLQQRPPGQTLQPTALVHEAYMKLAQHERKDNPWESRAHFFAVAAKAMRQVLANRARDKAAQKRHPDRDRVTLSEATADPGEHPVDLIALHEALKELAEMDPHKAEIVELRFFGGLTMPEVAHVVGMSVATVEREWRVAKAWIGSRLG